MPSRQKKFIVFFVTKSSIRMFWQFLIFKFDAFCRLFYAFLLINCLNHCSFGFNRYCCIKKSKANEFFTEIPKVISKFLSCGISNGFVHCFVLDQELKEVEIMI